MVELAFGGAPGTVVRAGAVVLVGRMEHPIAGPAVQLPAVGAPEGITRRVRREGPRAGAQRVHYAPARIRPPGQPSSGAASTCRGS